jgi:hydroxymethylglutaryl-CoA lyase
MDFEIIECPRDAMQGIKHFIPTEVKIAYMHQLMQVGFPVLDCGSFVHPSAVPQMADTPEVIRAIEEMDSPTSLLVIVANERGAIRAAAFSRVAFLGYPFSVSETFQRRNTNSTRENAFLTLQKISEIAHVSGKEIVCYISMGFGNPYGDAFSETEVLEWISRISALGITIFSLADTTSQATPEGIRILYKMCTEAFPHLTFGVHLHAAPFQWEEKLSAAIDAGCRRIDSAMLGYGGCPFANDQMVGNLPTEQVLPWLRMRYQFNGLQINNSLTQMASHTYQYLG